MKALSRTPELLASRMKKKEVLRGSSAFDARASGKAAW